MSEGNQDSTPVPDQQGGGRQGPDQRRGPAEGGAGRSSPTFNPTAILPDEQWRRLFGLARRVRESEPWLTIRESDFLGIQMPGSGETVFVSVMGLNGEHLALALYPTVRDLHGFLKVVYGMRSEIPSLLAAALRDTGFRPSKVAVCKSWLFEMAQFG